MCTGTAVRNILYGRSAELKILYANAAQEDLYAYCRTRIVLHRKTLYANMFYREKDRITVQGMLYRNIVQKKIRTM